MYQVVFIRHGITEWATRFTGWTDIDVSAVGVEKTLHYGKLLKEKGFTFDLAYDSYLRRAIRTMWAALDGLDEMHIPIIHDWRLNERHYGALQGMNKAEAAKEFGDEQVLIWRRSYDTPPPKLDWDDKRHARFDPKYKDFDPKSLPNGECLKDVLERVVPLWEGEVVPNVQDGKKIIISASHNSMRALFKHIDKISDEDIVKLNIPYCIPLVYEFDDQMQVIRHYYLETDEEVARVIESIKNQTKS